MKVTDLQADMARRWPHSIRQVAWSALTDEIRLICTCGWQSEPYNAGDEAAALAAHTAHIQSNDPIPHRSS